MAQLKILSHLLLSQSISFWYSDTFIMIWYESPKFDNMQDGDGMMPLPFVADKYCDEPLTGLNGP